MEELQLSEYLAYAIKHKKLFLCVTLPLLILILIFAMTWSNYYAEATVEIAQSEIPDSLTAPTGSNPADLLESLADRRISRLEQKVLSTGSLVEIITKFNLYEKMRSSTPIADVADKMRSKIKVGLVSSSLANPASAQKVSASELSAIAFTLGFSYTNAALSQQVTNELVSRFLDEDIKERRMQAQQTSEFLESQLKILEASLSDQEKQIAVFRAEHGDTRPEMLAFNQQAAANAQSNLQSLDARVEANLGEQGALRGQLATLDPYSRVLADGQLLTTPTIQLKTLRSNYAALTARYGPTHPDVLRAKRQIESLEAQTTAGGNDSAVLQETRDDLRGRLETAEKTYGPENPEVLSLKRQLANLDKQAASARARGGTDALIKKDADNPSYLQTVAQLRTTEEQYKALLKQRDLQEEELQKYQKAVIQNPEAEQKLAQLSRDYDNSQMRYRDLKAKKMSADMSTAIEEDRSGERLLVIDPPDMPHSTKPSRLLFFLGAFILSPLAGIGALFAKRISTPCVVGAVHLERVTGVAPLMTIPHLETETERRNNARRKKIFAIGVTLAFVLLLIVFSYTVMPLDVLGAVIARKLGLS